MEQLAIKHTWKRVDTTISNIFKEDYRAGQAGYRRILVINIHYNHEWRAIKRGRVTHHMLGSKKRGHINDYLCTSLFEGRSKYGAKRWESDSAVQDIKKSHHKCQGLLSTETKQNTTRVSGVTRKPLNTHHMSGPYTLRFFYENSGKKVQNCLHQTLHVPNYKMLALYYDGVMCNSMPLTNRKRVYDFSKKKHF